MFNEQIEKFNTKLEKGETIMIIEGNLKPIDRRFPNVNNRIEISLIQNSKVDELEDATCKLNELESMNFELVAN